MTQLRDMLAEPQHRQIETFSGEGFVLDLYAERTNEPVWLWHYCLTGQGISEQVGTFRGEGAEIADILLAPVGCMIGFGVDSEAHRPGWRGIVRNPRLSA